MTSKIIAEANSWLGTKFKHQGRIKINENDQGGCDCLGFIMGLGIKTKHGNLLEDYDQSNYPKLITSNELKDKLDVLLKTVPKCEIQIADILLIRIKNWPQHLALVVEKNEESVIIIHSYAQARKVVKQHLPNEWYKNIVGVYRSS